MSDIPDWWDALVLGVASWRVFHLFAYDDLTGRIRRYVTKGRDRTSEFVECPYCLGFWVVVGWWVAWLIWPRGTLLVAVPFMLSGIVVGTQKFLSDE